MWFTGGASDGVETQAFGRSQNLQNNPARYLPYMLCTRTQTIQHVVLFLFFLLFLFKLEQAELIASDLSAQTWKLVVTKND